MRTTVPDPGAAPLVERGHDAVGAVHPGEQVGDRDAHPLRVVGPRARQRHQARLALGDLVVARAPALRPVVAESGDGEDDQLRVALLQLGDPEAEPLEDAGAEVLHQDVGPVDQAQQDLAVGLVLEVEGDGLLVAVGGQEVRRLPGVGPAHERRSPAAGVVAVPGCLDLDHPGTEVAEHHGGVRTGQGAGEVDDEHAVERSLVHVSSGHGRHQPGSTSAAHTRSGPARTTITL